jgi:hypothetical protein
MNKLFSILIIGCFLIVGCSSENAEENKELDNVSSEVVKGGTKTVVFSSKDSLEITADYYPNPDAERIIILCHQAEFSRAEYKDIAPRLVDSGYACLAIDLRSGKEVYGVTNETSKRAEELGLSTKYIDAKQDIEAAVDYVSTNSNREVYLWGSSYSASLVLMVGSKDERVKRIVAFSPGEYFNNQSTVKSAILGLKTPTFITGSNVEVEMVVEPLVNVLPKHNVVYFKPDFVTDHGSKTLTAANGERVYEALFEFL